MRTIRAQSGVSLRQLLPRAQFLGGDDILAQSCCGRWEECAKDDVYVALVDPTGDGHDFAQQAIGRGASAVLGERLLAVRSTQCIVDDTRRAYGQLCQALAGFPSQRLSTIGVTGTDGKTTTSELIWSILQAAGCSPAIVRAPATELPDPSSRDMLPTPLLAERMARLVLDQRSHAVLETSSWMLSQHQLSGIELDVAAITNIRRNHLELHGSETNYRAVKRRILDYLRPTGLAVINADDPASFDWLDKLDRPTLTIGLSRQAELTARVIEKSAFEQTFLLCAGSESVPVRTRLVGRYNVYNCLTAAAIGLWMGMDLGTIANGLQQVQILPGILQPICAGQPFGVFVDAARTPARLATALATLRSICTGRIIAVVAADSQGRRDEQCHVGQMLEKHAGVPIISQAHSPASPDLECIHQVLDGFERPGKAHVIPDRLRAIHHALSIAKPGDAVLIARGNRLRRQSSDAGNLSDQEICRSILGGAHQPLPEPQEPARRAIFPIDRYRRG